MASMAIMTGSAGGAPLVVAANADLAYCVEELSAAFRAQEKSADLRFVLGTTAELYEKLSHDAPMDVFLASDMRLQANLVIDGKADPDTWTIYAAGRVVIWTLDKRFDVSKGIKVLADPRAKRIAIIDPPQHPYGAAAFMLIEKSGLSKTITPHLVRSDDIEKTASLIQSGKAQLGVVSYATVLAPPRKGKGAYFLIPAQEHDLIEQGAIVTKHGKSHPLARRFVHFLQTPTAQAILNRNGFLKPPMSDERARHP